MLLGFTQQCAQFKFNFIMLLKNYAQPTKSSKLKSKGISMEEYPQKTQTIAERINELIKSAPKPEPSQKTTEVLQAQIDALRSAFNTLADVVVEEMNRTKQEVLAEASIIAQGSHKRDEEDLNKLTFDLSNVQMQSKGGLKELELGIRKDLETVNKSLEAYKQDTQQELVSNKVIRGVLRRMKDVLSTHTMQMEQFAEKVSEKDHQLMDIGEVIEGTKRELAQTNQKIAEIYSYRDNACKEEIAMMKSELKEMSKKVTSCFLKDDSGKLSELQKEISLLENNVKIIRAELTEGTIENIKWKSYADKEFATLSADIEKIQKENLATYNSKDIEELRQEIIKLSADSRLESKKLSGLEELLITQRKELFTNISEVEGYFISKMETLKRDLAGVAQRIGYRLTQLIYQCQNTRIRQQVCECSVISSCRSSSRLRGHTFQQGRQTPLWQGKRILRKA
eukprot:TRINITY_DN89048_c0_g1_i1.p2 TRINITY_DN89048_c0_g1~~TRINITY_DN89048_c0_g1_i1.p2  ORF type:complete len:453 (+),score=44.35 TRINITY_DN89048_c0_g1_i1:1383-2741(+)